MDLTASSSSTSISSKDSEEATLLIAAVRAGEVDKVDSLLQQGCSVNQVSGEHLTSPIMLACYLENAQNRMAIFKLLLNHNADHEQVDDNGQNTMMHACSQGLEEEMEAIMEKKAYDFNSTDKHGNNLLHYCAKAGKLAILKKVLGVMVQHTLNINTKNNSGQTPMDIALLEKNLKCAEKLRLAGGQSMLPKIIVTGSIVHPMMPEMRCCMEWHGGEKWLTLPPPSADACKSNSASTKSKLPPIAEEAAMKSGAENQPAPNDENRNANNS